MEVQDASPSHKLAEWKEYASEYKWRQYNWKGKIGAILKRIYDRVFGLPKGIYKCTLKHGSHVRVKHNVPIPKQVFEQVYIVYTQRVNPKYYYSYRMFLEKTGIYWMNLSIICLHLANI